MLRSFLRARARLACPKKSHGPQISHAARNFHNVPFHDDLTPANDELFNLEDFQHYKEAPDVQRKREKLGFPGQSESLAKTETPQETPAATKEEERFFEAANISSFADACEAREPVVFVSKLSDPYLNLAIEDYVYQKMPLPQSHNCNRLMFYVNSPCVVIGKNQNPWKEVNLPILNNLRIPLVRRRSGGGTVVHDLGNVNYSFMTTKENFDRFTFANLVTKAVNAVAPPGKKIQVNERGDIVLQQGNSKVSGSAYKLSKGKSYHHGTMLLNSKLDILRKLLHRDESQIGTVETTSAVASVKSPVENVLVPRNVFIDAVTSGFEDEYGTPVRQEPEEGEYDQNELLGLTGFVEAFSRKAKVVTVDENTDLPAEIEEARNELKTWEWRFGVTPKFTHTFKHPTRDLSVEITVEKKGIVKKFALMQSTSEEEEAFTYLSHVLERGDSIQYTGEKIAGFVLDDELSEWLGNAIDGSS